MTRDRAGSTGSFYGRDLARIHDAGFSRFCLEAAPGILAILRRGGVRQGRVLDLGCGSGLLVRRLAAEGYRAIGVDVSPAMIALARARVPGARFLRGSLHDIPLPSCDAIVSTGECVNYLCGSGARGELGGLFRRAARALRSGGLLVFDLLAPSRPGMLRAARTWAEGEGWAVLVDASVDARRRVLARRITTFYRTGRAWRRGQETHRLGLPPAGAVAAALREAGFRARRLRGYGGLRFSRPGHVAFVAVRRGDRSRS